MKTERLIKNLQRYATVVFHDVRKYIIILRQKQTGASLPLHTVETLPTTKLS